MAYVGDNQVVVAGNRLLEECDCCIIVEEGHGVQSVILEGRCQFTVTAYGPWDSNYQLPRRSCIGVNSGNKDVGCGDSSDQEANGDEIAHGG